MLEIKGLEKAFGDLKILNGIDLTVRDGDVIAVLGPSGSGKTTFLRAVSMLEPANAGTMNLDGTVYDLAHLGKKEILDFRRKIGFVFQNYNLFNNKTALQNVTEGLIVARRMKRKAAEEIGHRALQKVGMDDRADFYPSQLSGGQQQRVSIARALALDPHILFLDEPTSALDPELTGEVLQVIRNLAQEGITMILVTHEMAFARDVADRIVFMEHGVVADDRAPQDFFNQPLNERISNFINQTVYHGEETFVSQGEGI